MNNVNYRLNAYLYARLGERIGDSLHVRLNASLFEMLDERLSVRTLRTHTTLNN